MSEDKLMKDTLLLCDNLISQYVGIYADFIFGAIKRAQTPESLAVFDEKTLKHTINNQLIDIAKSINETSRIERKFSAKYDCNFMFGQCFVPEIDELINDITAIEFATSLKEKKSISNQILKENNWDTTLTPKATIILLEKQKNKIINENSKDIFARIKRLREKEDNVSIFASKYYIDEDIIKADLQKYTSQKQLLRRQCKQLVRNHMECNVSFWLNDFNNKIYQISNKKHSIEFSPKENKMETINRVRDSVINEKVY